MALSTDFTSNYLRSRKTDMNSKTDTKIKVQEYRGKFKVIEKKKWPPEKLRPYSKHTYIVEDNYEMQELRESIREFGFTTEVHVREIPGVKDEYETLAGHRRTYAATKEKLSSVPIVVLEISEAEAEKYVIRDNIGQRVFKPSEIARTYKRLYEIYKSEGKKYDEIMEQLVSDSEELGKKLSQQRIRRIMFVADLCDEFAKMVDTEELADMAAEHIAQIPVKEQELIWEFIKNDENAKLDINSAKVLKEVAGKKGLTPELIKNCFYPPVTKSKSKDKPLKIKDKKNGIEVNIVSSELSVELAKKYNKKEIVKIGEELSEVIERFLKEKL